MFKKGMMFVILCIVNIPLSFAGWEVTWIDKFDGSGVNWTIGRRKFKLTIAMKFNVIPMLKPQTNVIIKSQTAP